MKIQACYEALGGDYNEAQSRLMNEVLVRKFALKFLNDPSYGELEAAMRAQDTETAFRAAHTLKGVAKNLAFTRLGESASQLTELLRGGDFAAAQDYYPTVETDYALTLGALQQLD